MPSHQRRLCNSNISLAFTNFCCCLVEESNDLAGDVLATGLLVVHDTSGGGQDDVAELTRRQQTDGPLLQVGQLDVVAGRDDTSLVETAKELAWLQIS